MAKRKLTAFEKRKQTFSESKSLEEATKIVWNRPAGADESDGGGKNQRPVAAGMYQHYTTLNRILEKLITKRWYLTRGDSKKLNDLKEAKKYGRSNRPLMSRTYITCFGNGAGESVAMWGIYAKNDPLAVRLSLPREIVCQWMNELKGSLEDVKDKRRRLIGSLRIESVKFLDMIYVAVEDKEHPDQHDIRRTNTISWEGETSELGSNCDLKNVVAEANYAGWLKDYEWHHERESRLCIRLKRTIKDDAISIAIPDYVFEAMRFTFSPWLEGETMFNSLKASIETALTSNGHKLSCGFQRFRRSVLQGALNFSS